jgi:hypothetical protein
MKIKIIHNCMNTIIGTTAGVYIKPIFGKNIAGVYDVYTKDLYRYQLLYDSVISQLNIYLNYFSMGDYVNLIDKFTIKEYNKLIIRADPRTFATTIIDDLNGFEYDPAKFDLMRQSTYNAVDGLEKTITLVKQNLDFQEDIIILKRDYKDVLEDPVKLRDYINLHKLDVIPFQASEPFNTKVELKPWYKVYFLKYGPPNDGVFKSELLAQIVIDLIASKTITEDQFINS